MRSARFSLNLSWDQLWELKWALEARAQERVKLAAETYVMRRDRQFFFTTDQEAQHTIDRRMAEAQAAAELVARIDRKVRPPRKIAHTKRKAVRHA